MVLYGRDRDIAFFCGLLQRATRGRSAHVLVSGDVGVGKTALLDHVADVAHDEGFVIMRCAGVDSDFQLTLSGLGVLVHSLGALSSRLPAHLRRAVQVFDGPGLPPERTRPAGSLLLELFGQLASRSPLLVVVDDVQWLDPASMRAIHFAARRLGVQDPCVVLLGMRSGADRPVEGFVEHDLRGLSAASGTEMLRAEHPSLTRRETETLVVETGGNPLAMLHAARALVPLPPGPGRDAILAVAPAIEDLIRRRLGSLARDAFHAVTVASFEDSGELAPLCAALARLSLPSTVLADVETSGLIRLGPGVFAFEHPLVRTVVRASVRADRRREIHRVLSTVHEAQGDAETATWHRVSAALEPDDELMRQLVLIGERALSRADPSAAADAFEAAAAMSRRRADRALCLLSAGRAAALTGADALPRLERAQAAGAGTPVEAEAVLEQMLVMIWSGRLKAATAFFAETARLIDGVGADPGVVAAMGGLDALAQWLRVDTDTYAGLAARNWSPSRGSAPIGGGLSVIPPLSYCWSTILRGEADLPLLRSCAETLEAHGAPALGPPVMTALLAAGELPSARRLGSALINRARGSGDAASVAWLQGCHAWLNAELGDLRSARADVAEALDLAPWTAGPWALDTARTTMVRIAALTGDEEQCRQFAAEILTTGEHTDFMGNALQVRQLLGLLELGAGRPESAIGILDPVSQALAALGVKSISLFSVLPDLLEAHVLCGHDDEADAILSRIKEAHRDPSPLAVGRLRRSTGWRAADFDEEFDASHRAFAAVGALIEVGRTELAWGRRLRQSRRLVEARSRLGRAEATLAGAGSRTFAAQARRELIAAGGRDRASLTRAKDGPDPLKTLTPREHQIAALAARGDSTRQISTALFLSPKTVETHLTRVYRKLDVRSRAGLAHRYRTR